MSARRHDSAFRALLAGAAGSGLASPIWAAAAQAPVEDIRDIRGPRPIASPELVWLLAGAGVLALLAAYALWRWMKRRRKAPPISDSELALARLDAARALMQPGGGREFSIEVSAAVREFIERRFRVMAAHRTTHEFLHDTVLSGDSSLAAHRELLGDFLQSCDLAKFGGWNLTLEQMGSMLASAQRFVESAAVAPAAGVSAEPDVRAAESKPHVSLPSA